MSNLPLIGISMGDPAGVGPEIILKAAGDSSVRERCRLLVIGNRDFLAYQSGLSGNHMEICEASGAGGFDEKDVLNVISLETPQDVLPGVVSAECGRAAGTYIKKGVELALQGKIDAIVTAPISKDSFNRGGFNYPGHTEFLSELTGVSDFAMMLMGKTLKVVLLTIHCPLMSVAGRLSEGETLRIIRLTDRALREDFGIKAPRIALASLNPHAGEGGIFGREEAEILLPAAGRARGEGIDVTDPMPSDTLFYKAVRGGYDVVVCPYHDQGLIPLKMLHFDDGVNVTLGLPLIRTSPDHGTAFDIAGKGIARPDSLVAAIHTALDMVEARNNNGRGRGL